MIRRSARGFASIFAVVTALACSGSPQGLPDTTGPGDVPADAVGADSQGDGTVQPDLVQGDGTIGPAGYATLRFKVDDSANQTYADKQMKWTGSFRCAVPKGQKCPDKDLVLEYASSWLPSDGPFPMLYDDGPASEGGHEPPGAAKGDHVFEVQAFFKAEDDTVLDYGVLNELDGWIWVGPNGQITIPKGSEALITADPLVLPTFGDRDLRVTLDVKALHPDFSTINANDYDFYFKSSANSWTNVQLLDDGDVEGNGDLAASDGVFTFVQSKRLGSHDGLLAVGQHAQFTFVFTVKGGAPEDGQEYKSGTQGLGAGVEAFVAGPGGPFLPEPIVLERAARGKEFNTTVVVGGGKPWCKQDEDCFGGVACKEDGCGEGSTGKSSPSISAMDPVSGPAAGGTAVTLTGTDFRTGASVSFGGASATDVKVVSANTVTLVTPAHAPGKVDVTLVNADGGQFTATGAFEYASGGTSQPQITTIVPSQGPATGDTPVTITGSDFRDGLALTFGDVPATGVVVVSATTVTARTPAHAAGKVAVKVRNADGGEAVTAEGFEYLGGGTVSKPVIYLVDPPKGSTAGGDEVTLTGKDFQANATVKFGDTPATSVSFTNSAEVRVITPAHAVGKVDVILTNPDGGTNTYPSAFEFVEGVQVNLPDWGRLNAPLYVDVNEGQDSGTLWAEVYEKGVTEDGGGEGIVLAQVGHGPLASDPTAAGATWEWLDATYDHANGNNAVFAGSLKLPAGSYAFTFRFSVDGGNHWRPVDSEGKTDAQGNLVFSFTMLGMLKVSAVEPGTPVMGGVSPATGPSTGGTLVTVTGSNLAGVTEVDLGGAKFPATAAADGLTLTFTTGAHAVGRADLKVTNGQGKTGTRKDAFAFVPRAGTAPTLDGDLGAGEWDPTWRVATNTADSDWGAGKNEVRDLYAAFDDTNLYLAVKGVCEGTNAIVVYVDRDFGGGSGYADMTALTDGDGGLDNAISSKVKVTQGGFGADFACGTQGMASVVGGLGDGAGWRSFSGSGGVGPGNFGWVSGTVKAGTSAFEAAVPLETLFTGAVPTGATIALVVRLVNNVGDATCALGLPASDATDAWVTPAAAVVPLK